MIYFNCDYTKGAHPNIIKILSDTNLEQTVGYGEDNYCKKAKKLIKKACKTDDIDIHFLVGGTQTNLSFISASLRPHEGVISAKTGHINVHESGAIEATGHKVLVIESSNDGKLCASSLADYMQEVTADNNKEHAVKPKMVYISNSTENGCVYTKKELEIISSICKKYNLYLYLDGARLGYALMSPNSDLTLNDLTKLCDAFYIGGTKVGALFGEALIIANKSLAEDFRYITKQKGGLLAKGRLLGLQFLCLFTDDLYFDISKNAIDTAFYIACELKAMGIKFLAEPQSNQIFPIFTNKQAQKLNELYVTETWENIDDNKKAIRLCTDWATTNEQSCELIKYIKENVITIQ